MRRASPFSPAAVLGLVGIGTALFVALLWMIGAGFVHGPLNNGGAHGAGKGLTGYAALSALLERQGWEVSLARGQAELARPGLVILTPPPDADGKAIAKIVEQRRRIGPTLVITPKWRSVPVGGGGVKAPGAKTGWVALVGTAPPDWKGFLDDVSVSLAPARGEPAWFGQGTSGTLPDGRAVLSGHGDTVVPLVALRPEGRVLAGYVAGGGRWPQLETLALQEGAELDADLPEDGGIYPLVVVFEPDLLDNYGMARPEGARLADLLVTAMDGGADVAFDLTFNGHARSANLLTLAFTPPFLAATLCLLLAMAASGWRAFLRFGPPLASGRAIAFGKRALVANAAGLVIRSGRLHLLGGPYAEAARQRLARAFALPRGAAPDSELAAIDRAGRLHGAADNAFSEICARLVRARSARDLVRAAQDLHALERTLTP